MINIKEILEHSKYEVGDILIVDKTGALFLVEDIVNFQYDFRILDNGTTRKDSIWYIDSHTGIRKVA